MATSVNTLFDQTEKKYHENKRKKYDKTIYNKTIIKQYYKAILYYIARQQIFLIINNI